MKKLNVFLVLLVALVFLSTAADAGAYDVYYGMLHNHSKFSDGSGRAVDAYKYARDNAGLDFFSLADHDCYPYPSDGLTVREYQKLQDIANSYNEDGTFVAFWGFEWTSDDLSWGGPSTLLAKGHLHIINSPDHCEADEEATNDMNELVDWMSTRDLVAFFNHPGQYNTTFDYFLFNYSDKIVGMELWNRSDDYYGTGTWYHNALDEGFYIGATGSQDHHGTRWGNVNEWRLAILAPELTRASLFDAMKARRFYSSRDKNLVLSFTCNGEQMGSRIDGGSLDFAIDASDGDGEMFSKIDLLKNGAVIETWSPDDTNPSVTTTTAGTLGDYFYVRVYQSGESGWRAISSPIFIITMDPDVTPPSPDPMTWETVPYPTDEGSISMTATTATDSESGVEYYFTCTAGGGNDSGWQSSTSYTDTPPGGILYTYTVTARDTSGNYNETAASTKEKARTVRDSVPPTPDPMTWVTVPYATGPYSIAMVATTATDPSGILYYFTCTAGGGNDSGWQDSPTYEDTGLSSATEYTYTVTASDNSVAHNTTGYSDPASATTSYANNLVLPANGGVLESFTSEYSSSYAASFLTNEITNEEGWCSVSNPGTQEFIYSFLDGSAANLDMAVIHVGTGGSSGYYSKDVEVLTSADGTTFTLAGSGTLLAQPNDSVAIDLGGVVAKKVMLRVTSGYRSDYWELAEFVVYGN